MCKKQYRPSLLFHGEAHPGAPGNSSVGGAVQGSGLHLCISTLAFRAVPAAQTPPPSGAGLQAVVLLPQRQGVGEVRQLQLPLGHVVEVGDAGRSEHTLCSENKEEKGRVPLWERSQDHPLRYPCGAPSLRQSRERREGLGDARSHPCW